MYTEQDLQFIRQQQKKRWILLVIPCVIFLGVMVYSLVARMEWLTALSTILLGCCLVFFYSMTIRPLHCYEVHLHNCLHGRTRQLDGLFESLSPDVSVVDGVKYYSMSVMWTNDDGDVVERLFYWDLEKAFPQVEKGEKVHIVYHDREVADLVVL